MSISFKSSQWLDAMILRSRRADVNKDFAKMADDASYGVIDPRVVYNLQAAARAMGQSTRWVMDHLIDSDGIEFRKEGDYKGIPGWRLIKWVEDDMRRKSEWKEEVAEGRPKTSSKSGLKPSS